MQRCVSCNKRVKHPLHFSSSSNAIILIVFTCTQGTRDIWNRNQCSKALKQTLFIFFDNVVCPNQDVERLHVPLKYTSVKRILLALLCHDHRHLRSVSCVTTVEEPNARLVPCYSAFYAWYRRGSSRKYVPCRYRHITVHHARFAFWRARDSACLHSCWYYFYIIVIYIPFSLCLI